MSTMKLMSSKEAMEYLQKHSDVVVMFADSDLEEEQPVMFIKKNKVDCYPIVAKAQTIATVLDDFIAQVNLYTERQDDLPQIKPQGRREIIMLRI